MNLKSLLNNLDTILLCSTTSGSPSLMVRCISKNLECLPALSSQPIVVPNEIGEV